MSDKPRDAIVNTNKNIGRKEWDGIKLGCDNPECFISVHSEGHSRPSAFCQCYNKTGKNCSAAEKYELSVRQSYQWVQDGYWKHAEPCDVCGKDSEIVVRDLKEGEPDNGWMTFSIVSSHKYCKKHYKPSITIMRDGKEVIDLNDKARTSRLEWEKEVGVESIK